MRDISMFRVITMSMLLVIIIIYVLYLNYLLLGQFFFCLFLAQITSTSLRPYKDGMINYFYKVYNQTDYLLKKSYIYLIFAKIVEFFKSLIQQRSLIALFNAMFDENFEQGVTLKREDGKENEIKINSFNDMKTIIYMVIGYVAITKIGLEKSFYILIGY